jgi:hypothetical protein
MTFDINLPRTPTDGSFLSWGLWAVRAPSAVASRSWPTLPLWWLELLGQLPM